MSRGVLINTIDTYIGTALYEEFLGENPAESAYELYGTWHSKDDSAKPAFIKKMLKRSKPVLFRKYMREKMDCYIFDLHSGRLDDLKWAVWALTNEPLDSEKTLIVISSVLSWGGNEPKMVEVKPKKKKPVEEGEEPKEENNEEEEKEEEEKEDEEKEEEKKEEEEEKKEEEKEKEPQLDENGNPIEPPKQEFDEYGNEILVAKLDEQGNEILPPNDDDFEYYFEDDYKEKKKKELEEQKKKEREELIKKLKEENPDAEIPPEEEPKEEEKKEEDKENEEKKEENEEENKELNEELLEGEEGEEKKRVYKKIIKVKIIKPKIFKRVGFREKDYKQRIPIDFYKHFKEYEDYLLNLKFENLSIFIICAGIPYGGCETTFNYFFKSAWLQNPIELPYYGDGTNLIPTIHIKDLARIVKRLADNKSEFPYIFAVDKTKDTSLKNIISSISINIGSGKTVSVPYNKNLIKNIVLKEDDFFIDKEKYEKNKLIMNITKHELSWTRFLGIDVMLKKSKFLGEDYEWYCKEGIPSNCQKLLKEFCSYRLLRPLKIILNCQNENYRKLFAEKISKFYNIPVLNFELMMEKLNQSISENEEEKFMNEKYYKLKERLDFLEQHPEFINEANELLYDKTEILFECLKYLLKSNAAVNRGYVLEGIPVNIEEINSIYYYKKEVKPNPEEEEEKPPEEEEIEEEEEEKKEEAEEKKEEENKEGEDEEKKEGEENKEGEEEEKKEGEDEEKKEGEEEEKKEEENKEEEKKEEENKDGEGEEGEGKKKKKKKKKKKIKPKKYKKKFEKTLLPESVITLSKIDKETSDVDNTFWEVEQFYQDNQIEIMNLVYEDEDKDDPEETFEMMRIYIERNGRPFNYFRLKDEDINNNRINYVENKKKDIDNNLKKEEEIKQKKIDEEEELYWKKMEERIEAIKKDKKQLEQNQEVPTRKFLLVNIMPTLTKGLLEVSKINPIDPIDYLADFLFTNSTGEK